MGTKNKKIEIVTGSVSNRGNVDSIDNLRAYATPNLEVYRSMFLYDDTFTGDIKKYDGTFEINEIILDVDIKDGDLNNIKGLYAFLADEFTDEYFRFWFSGTGFHVHLPDLFQLGPRKDLPGVIRLTLDKIFVGYGVDSIYDRARLIRAEYSYNKKNATYKIPLDHDDMFHLKYEELIKKAQEVPDFENGLEYPSLVQNPPAWWEDRVRWPKPRQDTHIIDKPSTNSKQKLTSHVTCVQKMYNHGPVYGKRHMTVLRMVSAWKRSGIPIDGSAALVNSWSNDFASRDEVNKILTSVYEWEHDGYSCNDPVMDSFCDSKCKFYRKKDYGVEVFNADNMSEQFLEFVNADLSDKSFDLNDMYDLGNSYKFTEGELITMIGDTKLGKTAFIQNIVTRANNFKCLYLSLEVNQKLMWRRFCQIAFNKDKHEITKHYIDGDHDFMNKAKDKLGHIKILTVSPEINSIIDIISTLQPKVIVIDTIDEIRVDYVNDSLVKMQKIVSKLKEIAQKYEVIIFAVSHISKTAAYDGTLTRHSAKGDSSIEQKSDKLIGISAPNPQSKARIIESIVARDESGFKLRCWFNHESFRFQQASD